MLVHIHQNKTGGSTVNRVLRSSYGMRHCAVEPWHPNMWADPPFTNDDLARIRKLYPRLRSVAGHRVVGYEDLQPVVGDEIEYFTFVRNPVKASVSSFQHKKQISGKPDDFESWIEQEWTRNRQTKMIAGAADVNEAIRIIEKKNIFVGTTEDFDESLLLLKTLMAPDLNISYHKVNVAPRRAIADELLGSERSLAILNEAHQLDMELWNYVRNEIFPTYRRAYGPGFDEAVAVYRQTLPGKFNERNVIASRLKVHLVYRPLRFLSRKGVRIV